MAVGRALPCVYCGGTHASPAEIRDCWQRSEGVEVEVRVEEGETPPVTSAPVVSGPVVSGPVDRGPLTLGRNVVVAPGQPAPSAWADAPRVAVALTADCVAELQRLAHQRVGAVLEVAADVAPEAMAPVGTSQPAHQLGARFTFVADSLRHLLVSNSVDARSGGSFSLVDAAVRHGARPGRRTATATWCCPTVGAAWLDGGPPRFTAPDRRRARAATGSASSTVAACRSRRQRHRRRPGARPAGRGHPRRRRGADHRPGRVRQDAGAHRARPPPRCTQWQPAARRRCASWRSTSAPRRRCCDRTTDLRGLQVRTLNAIALAIVNGSAPFAPQPRATGAPSTSPRCAGSSASSVSFPRKRNADPVATWIEALSVARLGLREPRRRGGDVRRRRRRLRARSSRRTAPRSPAPGSARLRRADPPRHRAAARPIPTSRAAAQRACRVLLVDEFQDLTPAHLLLVRLLAGPDGAVFGVGDDDQTIYGYNGADPGWLIDFADAVPRRRATTRWRSTTAAPPASCARPTRCCATTAGASPR